jgi:hypothetical protein
MAKNRPAAPAADPKAEYQKNLDGAFEEVVADLESTREVLKGKVDEIAAAIKEQLVTPTK